MNVYQEALSYLESHHAAGGEALEDVFHEEAVSCFLSPLCSESIDFPDTPTSCSREEMLEKRLVVLRGILESEEVYLRELDALLAPMKALRASAGTSQPVLSSQQVQTVFYQIPELKDIHQSFYSGLKARLGSHTPLDVGSGQETVTSCSNSELEMGDLFLKLVNHLGLYGGFIENYEKAVEVVRKCTQANPLFRTLAETLYINGADKARTACTLEALLYKPLDRVTKTTLVLRDLLKTTPVEHKDYAALQEALRLSQSFLSGVNESSQSKREVTLTHGMRRQLMRDGFVVDASEGVRSLRHFFLYTDLLLCTRFKHAGRGKQDQYRFSWYLPLAGLRTRWVADHEQPPDTTVRLLTLRTKMFLLRQQLQQNPKGTRGLTWTARNRKKLEQMELLLLTHSPVYRLDLHSPSGKSHTLFFSSLYELEEWRDAIHKLTTGNIETIPPDLLTLTSACVKLRMTQQPHLHSSVAAEDGKSLCGTVSVAIHSASGLQEPACVYVCVEVDGYEFYDKRAQTHSSVRSLNPLWDQELSFLVDGAQKMMVLCVSQSDGEEAVLGKTTVQLDSTSLSCRWRRQTLQVGQLEVTLSLKYCPHPLEAPGAPIQQPPVFCVPIEKVAQQEGVLVPHVVRCCVEEVERRGMDEVGIYRISGTATDICSLKAVFNTNLREAVTRLRSAEVNTVSGVLKLYFRELPEPLVPSDLFQSLAKTLDIQDMNSRLVSMLSLLQSSPDVSRNTFLYLMHHLQRVAKRQDVNKMTLMNLATVFGPSLLRPPAAGLEHNGVTVDISQEVVIQVQVVFSFLQSNNLPEAQTSLPYGSDTEEETTHM
ncbi:PREDICTED: active breakpoint cluster region-related protein-like isoform X2 [Poecilia mexicana]|uniref:active breakpoint cluster region-related protein-like isoform X2 n=1 Tax=Poecilia mexicana TaxID=48701 RepID=UPI00072DB129|nr:PREDICTED: active breakpoint cluster region-related protein-like isoform X2 [Poecilia mexicana]